MDITIQRNNPKYAKVGISGSLDSTSVADTAKTYKQLAEQGVKRVLIELSGSEAGLGALVGHKDDLIKSLAPFEKIAIHVPTAEAAFKIKTISSHDESRVKICYETKDAIAWVSA